MHHFLKSRCKLAMRPSEGPVPHAPFGPLQPSGVFAYVAGRRSQSAIAPFVRRHADAHGVKSATLEPLELEQIAKGD